MANTNTPSGLEVIRASGAYDFNAQGNLYYVTAGDTNAFYLNDAVKVGPGGDANGVPAVTKITNGTDAIRGSLQAIFPTELNPASLVGSALDLAATNIPATKTRGYYVLVNDDYSTIYSVQDDGITTANLTGPSCNKNSSLTITAGATTTSKSGTVLLSSSFATTNTLCMKLFGLVQRPGNEFAAYAKWQCRINVSDWPPTGGTGA